MRAGDDLGRIFRVVRPGAKLRPVADLTKLDLPALVAALDTPNGAARDRVQRELFFRGAPGVIPLLARIAEASTLAAVRLQALALLAACDGLTVERVAAALRDPDPGFRRFALGIAERYLRSPSVLDSQLAALDALLPLVAPPSGAAVTGRHLVVLAALQDGVDARKIRIEHPPLAAGDAAAAALERIRVAYAETGRIAQDTAVPLVERQAAVRLLGRGFNAFERDVRILVSLLNGAEEPLLLQSALETIRRSASDRVPAVLLENWSRFPPSVRPTVIEILTGRADWTDRFLSAIPASNRQRLLRSTQPKVQARAKSLFAGPGTTNREAVMARYRAVSTLTGDAQRGLQVFNQACSACHVFVGTNSVGPPLGTYRDKSIDDFLIAILDPNAAIEPKYTGYAVTPKDGREFAGVISDESGAGFTLTMSGNASQLIARQDVSAIAALGTSLMPDGLEAAVSPQEMADLIAYLTSNR